MSGAEPFFELSFPPPLSSKTGASRSRAHPQRCLSALPTSWSRGGCTGSERPGGAKERRKRTKTERGQGRRDQGSKDKKTRKYYFLGALSREGRKKRGRRLFSAALVFFPDRTPAPSNLLATKRSNTIRKRQSLWGLPEGRDGIGEGGREPAGGRCQN